MKIKEYLPVTYRLVSQHVDPGWEHTKFASQKYKNVIQLEEKWAWACLNALFDLFGECEHTPDRLAGFYQFLAERWARIKDIYYLHYTTQYRSSLTLACASLAHELPGKHRHETLMPGINTVNDHLTTKVFDNATNQWFVKEIIDFAGVDAQTDETYLKQSYMAAGAEIGLLIDPEEINAAVFQQLKLEQIQDAIQRARVLSEPHKIQLHHFVLDSHFRVIDIYGSLTSAIKDNLYKHSYIAGPMGSTKDLNAAELEKVIHHSRQATVYAVSLSTLWQKKKESYSIGGFLLRLISGLRAGGVSSKNSGGTQEGLPGKASFESVESFYNLTKQLTNNQLERLLDINKDEGINKSFRYYWYRLLAATNWCLQVEDYPIINEFFGICVDEYNLGQADAPIVIENSLSINIAASPRNGVRIETPRISTPVVLVPARQANSVVAASENIPPQTVAPVIAMAVEETIEIEDSDKTNLFKFLTQVSKEQKPFNDTPCVEIYSGCLDTMLSDNPWLYDEVPVIHQDLEKDVLSKMQSEFDKAKESFERGMNDNQLEHVSFSDLKSLGLQFMTSLNNESPELKKLCCSLIATPEALIFFLKNTPSRHRRWLLRTYLSVDLRVLVDTPAKFMNICSMLTSDEQHVLLGAIKEFYTNCFLRELFPDFTSLTNAMTWIRAAWVQHYLLENLGKKHMRLLISFAEDLNLIGLPQYLHATSYNFLFKLLTPLYVERVKEIYRIPPVQTFLMGLPQSFLALAGQTVTSLSLHSLGLFRNDKRRMDQVEDSNKRVRFEEEEVSDRVMAPASLRR
jgi:hypothetical protein